MPWIKVQPKSGHKINADLFDFIDDNGEVIGQQVFLPHRWKKWKLATDYTFPLLYTSGEEVVVDNVYAFLDKAFFTDQILFIDVLDGTEYAYNASFNAWFSWLEADDAELAAMMYGGDATLEKLETIKPLTEAFEKVYTGAINAVGGALGAVGDTAAGVGDAAHGLGEGVKDVGAGVGDAAHGIDEGVKDVGGLTKRLLDNLPTLLMVGAGILLLMAMRK